MRRKKINLKAIVCALMSSAMILTLVTPASAATARATTMKLEKTEGTVTLKTQNGSTRKITKGMRLYNGNTLSTAKYSYAHISLDSTKAVKLDQSSSATLRQIGKQLELLVKSGKLFFNVSKKLSAKESMNVRTSTMVTGVRGTCGVVEFVSSKQSKLYLIEGQVTLGTGSNATVVQGGQVATVILQDKPATSEPGKPDKGDQNVIAVEKLPEKNIPPVALQEIVADPVLQEKIEKTTELKIEKIEEALEQFEKEEAERIEQEKAEQEKDEEKDQEKEQDEKKEDESTSSSGDGSYTPGTPAPTSATLYGTVSAAAINAALKSYSKVTVAASGTDTGDAAGNTTTITLEDNVTIPQNKVLIIETGEVSGSGQISVGSGTLIDTVGKASGAISDSNARLCTVNDTSVYASEFNTQVAGYINELAQKPATVTVNFQNPAVVKSNITLQPVSASNPMELNMGSNTLEIQSGTLTLASNVSVTGENSTATISLAGGNLALQGTSTSAELKNTGAGCAIAQTNENSSVTWNDTGLSVSANNTAINGAEVSGEIVILPKWVTVKSGCASVGDGSKIELQEAPSAFTTGIVTVEQLNRSLSVNQTVTFGAGAKITLNQGDKVTIPNGKTLDVQAEITGDPGKYSYGFDMSSGSVLDLADGATLKVTKTIGMNGTINVGTGTGATVLVENGGLLQADNINLTNGSSITNNGTIDGGTLSLEGTGTITNQKLIKIKTCKAKDGSSGVNYSYVDVNGDSIIVADGYGFSNNFITGVSRLACVMASSNSSNADTLFDPLVSVYANKLNQLAAEQMRGNRMINEKQVVQINVSSDVNVSDNITWDLAGAGVGMADFKVNVADGKALTLKNINSFGGTGETLIYVGGGATLTITEDGSITDRKPYINLGLATGSAISVADGAKVSLQDPDLKITVNNTADHIISGIQVTDKKVTVPGCVQTLAGYTCKVENSNDSNAYSSLSLVKGTGV